MRTRNWTLSFQYSYPGFHITKQAKTIPPPHLLPYLSVWIDRDSPTTIHALLKCHPFLANVADTPFLLLLVTLVSQDRRHWCRYPTNPQATMHVEYRDRSGFHWPTNSQCRLYHRYRWRWVDHYVFRWCRSGRPATCQRPALGIDRLRDRWGPSRLGS